MIARWPSKWIRSATYSFLMLNCVQWIIEIIVAIIIFLCLRYRYHHFPNMWHIFTFRDAYKVELLRKEKWKPGQNGSSCKLLIRESQFFSSWLQIHSETWTPREKRMAKSYGQHGDVLELWYWNWKSTSGKSLKLFSNLWETIAKHRNHFNSERRESFNLEYFSFIGEF